MSPSENQILHAVLTLLCILRISEYERTNVDRDHKDHGPDKNVGGESTVIIFISVHFGNNFANHIKSLSMKLISSPF